MLRSEVRIFLAPLMENEIAPEHQTFFEAALRAPTAHNAQPWRIFPAGSNVYELHYDNNDYLPFDPDDRDAYMAMGAFYETLDLNAQREGFKCELELVLQHEGSNLHVCTVTIRRLRSDEPVDPLSATVSNRMTNRSKTASTPLSPTLREALMKNGCVLFNSKKIARLVQEASIISWKSPNFVRDLKNWIRWRNDAPDGMSPECLGLSKLDQGALRFALWRGRLGRSLAWIYSTRDIRRTKMAPEVAVLTADNKELSTLFNAGRRLLRCWITICDAGAVYTPISIVVDERVTASKLDQMIGNGKCSVGVFRVGYTKTTVPHSNRRTLESIILKERPGK